MTQKQLKYFQTVYETGNIAQAADNLFVSRPVVSRAIQDLEEEFGATFFKRSKAGVTATEAGRAMYGMVMQVNSCLNAMTERLQRIESADYQRTLRVGVTPTNSRRICHLLYDSFLSRYPDVRLTVVERRVGALLEELASGTLDIAIGPGTNRDPLLYERLALYSVRLVLAVSEKDPLSTHQRVRIADIVGRPLACLGEPTPVVEKALYSSFAALKQEPYFMIRTSSLELLRELTQSNKVFAILPDDIIREWDGVAGIPLEFMSKVSTHKLFCNRAVPMNTAGEDLASFLEETFADDCSAAAYSTDQDETPPEEPPAPTAEGKGALSALLCSSGEARLPSLPMSFYTDLLDLPSCKIRGRCDNCGRCEH